MSNEKYTVVQHSGYGYGNKAEWAGGLEPRRVHGADIEVVQRLGGKLFDSWREADNYAAIESGPDIYPKAPGTFASLTIDGLAIYVPQPEAPPDTSAYPFRVGYVRHGDEGWIRLRCREDAEAFAAWGEEEGIFIDPFIEEAGS